MDDVERRRGGEIYAALAEYQRIHQTQLDRYADEALSVEDRLNTLRAANTPNINFARQLLIAAHFVGNSEDCAFAVSLLQKTYGDNAKKANEDNDLVVLHVTQIMNTDQK